MEKYSIQSIIDAIQEYLESQFEMALKKAVSEMKKPTEKLIANKSAILKEDYAYDDWVANVKGSLCFMQTQNLCFATHTSKGIHSSVRSDNIISLRSNNTEHLASSSCIASPCIDANSNNTGSHAGHLKNIVNFLNIQVSKNRVYSLIKNNNEAIFSFFEETFTVEHYEYLNSLLNIKISHPKTDERNKQVLFFTDENNYVCLVPLYPSSLANYLFKEIQHIKYSESFKKSRIARKENKSAETYKDIIKLAVTKLGGDNAQNVSRLNNEQSGINYLLPSLPPPSLAKAQAEAAHTFMPSKFASSIFSSKQLANKCKNAIEHIFSVVKDTRKTVDVRDKRKQALDEVLHIIFTLAATLRNTLPAGWSKDYQLDMHQKLWLDPRRAELDGEEAFAEKRSKDDWHTTVIADFASWVNQLLKTEFAKQKADFGDAEHIEWEQEFEDMQKRYERAGKGVFL